MKNALEIRRELIVSLYLQDYSQTVIANVFGISSSRIQKILNKSAVTKTRVVTQSDDVDEAFVAKFKEEFDKVFRSEP
jgi:hypothetical protein